MNNTQRKTLAAIFADPASPNIRWAAVEAPFIAGAGSRVTFRMNQIIASFHRPHPARQAKRYQVRDAREFLTKLGVQP